MKQIEKAPRTAVLTDSIYSALKIICSNISSNATARVWIEYDPDDGDQIPMWNAEVRPNGLLGVQRIAVKGPEIGLAVDALVKTVADGMRSGEVACVKPKGEA
jgi:hypothetical protein